MELSRAEQQLIDNSGTRLVRRIVQENSALAYLVFKIAAGNPGEWTPSRWQMLLEELESDERTLYVWVEAQLKAASEEGQPYEGNPRLGYQY